MKAGTKYLHTFIDDCPNQSIVQEALAQSPRHPLRSQCSVADWKAQVTETLPDDLKGSLPSVEEIEAELNTLVIEEAGE